jgi:hypothetical protein
VAAQPLPGGGGESAAGGTPATPRIGSAAALPEASLFPLRAPPDDDSGTSSDGTTRAVGLAASKRNFIWRTGIGFSLFVVGAGSVAPDCDNSKGYSAL